MKLYEITITHRPGPEPVLPDHPDLRYEFAKLLRVIGKLLQPAGHGLLRTFHYG